MTNRLDLNSEIEIEIENESEDFIKKENHFSINPNQLIRDYKDIKILSMNPKTKTELLRQVDEIRSDLRRISGIIGVFNGQF